MPGITSNGPTESHSADLRIEQPSPKEERERRNKSNALCAKVALFSIVQKSDHGDRCFAWCVKCLRSNNLAAPGPAMKLVGRLAARSPGLRFAPALEIERNCGADEILQGRVIDLVAFVDVDRAPDISVEAGVE